MRGREQEECENEKGEGGRGNSVKGRKGERKAGKDWELVWQGGSERGKERGKECEGKGEGEEVIMKFGVRDKEGIGRNAGREGGRGERGNSNVV